MFGTIELLTIFLRVLFQYVFVVLIVQAAIKTQLLEQESTLVNRISTLEKLVDKKRATLSDGGKKKSKS